MTFGIRDFLFIFLAIGVSGSALPIQAEDWPHWRGTHRDSVTTESSGWDSDSEVWPVKEAAWEINAGLGASSPVVVGGKVFTVGWKKDQDTVRCLDAETGTTLWEHSYPAPSYGRNAVGDQRMYTGTTATPEFDEESGLLFTLSCDGDLRAWDTKADGKPVWALNLCEKFKIPRRPQITKRKNTLRDYGYTTAPLVHENWVIVEVGDPKRGNLMGFDKLTGKQNWASENRDPAGHTGGLTPLTLDGIPCVAVATSFGLHVARLDGENAGKTASFFEWKTDFSNTIAGIAVHEQDVLISSRYNQMAMARLHLSLNNAPQEIWRNRYPTGVCTPVIHDGKLYFANKGVFCLDFETGDLDWAGGKIGDAGSCLVTADDRLITWGNGGDLSLIETAKRSPKKCVVLAEKPRIFSDEAWPHVVLANGRLFAKTLGGDLACFVIPQ